MSFDYDTTIINIAENMHKIVSSENVDILDSSSKKIVALRAAITATAKLYKKSFDVVYDEVSEYAAWFSIRAGMDELDRTFNDLSVTVPSV